jgi:hypothetical protein
MNVRNYLLVVLLFASLLLPSTLLAEVRSAPKDFLLTPVHDVEEDPYFEWVLMQSKTGGPLETAKIEYLIERVRNSPYTFVRNRTEHAANRAATHLAWKYGLRQSRIETAHEFIVNVASRSLKTGLAYLIKSSDGNQYPAGAVLENELRILEEHLKQKV